MSFRAVIEKTEKKLKEINIPNAEDIKVSVIVPVYNTEKYIDKCLLSLIQQTLKDIEIILIDDASTDNTAELLALYAKYDSRIKVVTHSKNLKQGSARNNGTKIASGKYVGFVDSDDWIDLDYYEKLYTAAKKYDADIALATNVRIGNGRTKKRLNIKEEHYYTDLQSKFDICNLAKNPCPTNKIYKKEFLTNNNVVWPEGCYCEDKLFVTQAVYFANGVVCVPDINYYYYRNPTSTVNKRSKQHCKKLKKDKNLAKKSVLDFLRAQKADIRDRDFWAVTEKRYLCGIPLITKKEFLHTAKYYLFSIIKIKEEQI